MLSPKQKQEIESILRELALTLTVDINELKDRSKPVELDQQLMGRVSRVDAIQQQQMQLSALRRM